MNNDSNYNKFVTNVLRVAHNPPELDTSFVGMTKQSVLRVAHNPPELDTSFIGMTKSPRLPRI